MRCSASSIAVPTTPHQSPPATASPGGGSLSARRNHVEKPPERMLRGLVQLCAAFHKTLPQNFWYVKCNSFFGRCQAPRKRKPGRRRRPGFLVIQLQAQANLLHRISDFDELLANCDVPVTINVHLTQSSNNAAQHNKIPLSFSLHKTSKISFGK